jgi:hypothetical protein
MKAIRAWHKTLFTTASTAVSVFCMVTFGTAAALVFGLCAGMLEFLQVCCIECPFPVDELALLSLSAHAGKGESTTPNPLSRTGCDNIAIGDTALTLL